MDDNVGRVGEEGHDHPRREVVEDQFADRAEVEPFPPQPFLFLLSLLGRAGEGFPSGTCHDRPCGLARRLGRCDAVDHEGGQKDEEEHPGQVEVHGIQEQQQRRGGRAVGIALTLGAQCEALACHEK